MSKVQIFSMGWLVFIFLTGCATPPEPISARHLSSSKLSYTVESAVYADMVRVKDLRGNTICFKKNVELTPPQTSANFGFCTITPNRPYDVETMAGEKTYTSRIYAEEL